MDEMPQIRELATSDLCLLTYVQHMAETAQSDAAKRLFESFVEQERVRNKQCREEEER